MNPSNAPIEVFADIGCPFAYVGIKRLVEYRDRLGRNDFPIRVRAWPLEVVNNKPWDREFVAEEIEVIRAAVAPELFTNFDATVFPTSFMPALALAAAANRVSDPIGEAVSLDLRTLLFEQGADLGDIDVLRSVAGRFGVTFDPSDTSDVLADHGEGMSRGVIGSPHFFTSTGSWFCPALTVGRDEQGDLQVTTNPEKFERFMEECFV